jgi:hydroxypyruvate reductase
VKPRHIDVETWRRKEAVAIFRAALAAVDPARLVSEHLTVDGRTVTAHGPGGEVATWTVPTRVVGAGKAAARMAGACERILGAANVFGEVIVADGCAVPLASIRVSEAGHPLPDRRGEEATRRITALLTERRSGGTLCLVSGGASSLLVQPHPPVTLADKIRTTQLLLDSGAAISEINCVRKHLSTVKGGGIARLIAGAIVGLVISDVIGDDIATIGSGPTAPDPTTFADAWDALDRYALTSRVPSTVAQLLRRGAAGETAETLKPDTPDARRCRNFVIGNNRLALEAAAREATARGWNSQVDDRPVTGDTSVAARRWANRLREIAESHPHQPLCLVAGGETTVTVRGSGRGGRNQEFALAMAPALADAPITVLSAGTDGVDGPTDAAGAFVDGATMRHARSEGLDVDRTLAGNDSYGFFSHLGDLLLCGPTGTNVMDIKIALFGPPPRPVRD